MSWSIFGTSDEPYSGPKGALSSKSKSAVYEDGAWCGYCLKAGKRTWVDLYRTICPHCREVVTKDQLIVD